MLYASTKATFKKEFGQGQIKDEYFASMRVSFSLRIYIISQTILTAWIKKKSGHAMPKQKKLV